jgi:hypothetical protein
MFLPGQKLRALRTTHLLKWWAVAPAGLEVSFFFAT